MLESREISNSTTMDEEINSHADTLLETSDEENQVSNWLDRGEVSHHLMFLLSFVEIYFNFSWICTGLKW